MDASIWGAGRHLDVINLPRYDASMRTTLTLDPDVARLLDDAVHRERRSLKQVVNDALRRGLATPSPRRQPFRVKAHHSALRPGLDLTGFNKLADELEDEAILERARRRRS
jgi:hypothetical protein